MTIPCHCNAENCPHHSRERPPKEGSTPGFVADKLKKPYNSSVHRFENSARVQLQVNVPPDILQHFLDDESAWQNFCHELAPKLGVSPAAFTLNAEDGTVTVVIRDL